MLDNIKEFFKKFNKNNGKLINQKGTNKNAAKERLHLVLMQDRANVSADFLDLMKQEIIEVIKKYIVVDEKEIDVRLTNQSNDDGTNGIPALYANIPIINIKNDVKAEKIKEQNIEKTEEKDIEDKGEEEEKEIEEDTDIDSDDEASEETENDD